MSRTLPLLIELGTEELPVKALPALADAFRDNILKGLTGAGLDPGNDAADQPVLYTPRRLAVKVDAVAARQPDQSSQVLGPYLNIALDADGQPTRALQGFAAKAGVDWTQLDRISDNKGERFVHRSIRAGAETGTLLPQIITAAVKALPIPKPMRWGDHDHAFVRPLHWLVVLLGDQVVPCDVLGVTSDRHSRGHRFHHPGPVTLPTPDSYLEQLEAAHVIVDAARRKARIRSQVQALAEAAGGSAQIDPDILDQVNCLTEWPVAIAGTFERDFLRVPAEALIETMAANQKFFPVLDAQGHLSEHFIGVANIDSSQPDEVRKGYERVIRPRFADARFFFDEDLRQGLSTMNAGLAQVTYQAKLGTLADKVARVTNLAESIAGKVGVDPVLARRAASLSKADLQSRMVNELPELQGIAGRHYAAHDPALADLSPADRTALAAALDEVYMPRNAGDRIAPSALGQVLAIAERLDTLAGGFAAGLKPTGNRDPFALRRNALGLARTLVTGAFDLDLYALLEMASRPFADAVASDDLLAFVNERLVNWLPSEGFHNPVLNEAVLDARPTSQDVLPRLKSLAGFIDSVDGQALAAANKRCGNLLRKAMETGEVIAGQVQEHLLESDAERELVAQINAAEQVAAPLFAARDYVAALARLAQLRPAVDAFFDQVMVMADDPAVRANRLGLLNLLQTQFLRLADIGRLASG